MLFLVRAEPELLPEAPPQSTVRDMAHRAYQGQHYCLGCGTPASLAAIAATAIGPRWLDLCPPCHRAVWLANSGRDE